MNTETLVKSEGKTTPLDFRERWLQWRGVAWESIFGGREIRRAEPQRVDGQCHRNTFSLLNRSLSPPLNFLNAVTPQPYFQHYKWLPSLFLRRLNRRRFCLLLHLLSSLLPLLAVKASLSISLVLLSALPTAWYAIFASVLKFLQWRLNFYFFLFFYGCLSSIESEEFMLISINFIQFAAHVDM